MSTTSDFVPSQAAESVQGYTTRIVGLIYVDAEGRESIHCLDAFEIHSVFVKQRVAMAVDIRSLGFCLMGHVF
jgi:hypothetical protein